MTRPLSSTPISIVPSASELGSGLLGQRNLEIAIRALARDGLVVLEDMVEHAVLDRLNQKMVQDAYQLQARKDSPFNYNKGNIQQDPPMTADWFSSDIYTSKSFILTRALLPECALIADCRPNRHPSHIDCAWTKTFFAFRVREYSSAAY